VIVSSPGEKRKAIRIRPWVAPCIVVEGERRLSAYFTDLSVKGTRVSTEEAPPALHARVVVEVRLGRAVDVSRVPAQVKWVRPREKGCDFGLTFTGVNPELQRTLEGVVEEFRRLADTLS
jgi:hypothetical protein